MAVLRRVDGEGLRRQASTSASEFVLCPRGHRIGGAPGPAIGFARNRDLTCRNPRHAGFSRRDAVFIGGMRWCGSRRVGRFSLKRIR